MKTFQRKKEELSKLQDKFSKAKVAVFTSFAGEGEGKGLSVTEMGELKKTLRGNEAEYLVAKKTLINKAVGGKSEAVRIFDLEGSPGVALGYGDGVATAKAVYNFSKAHPALKLFGALFNGEFIDGRRATELANLPSRDVMLGRAVGMIQYPLTGLVNVLQANLRNLLLVLSNIKK